MMEYERESMGMNGAVYNAGRVVWSRCLAQAVGVYLKEKKPDNQHNGVCGTKSGTACRAERRQAVQRGNCIACNGSRLFNSDHVVCFARFWSLQRGGCISQHAVADPFVIAFDTPFFEQRFSFGRVEHLFGPVNPAATQSDGVGGIHQVAHDE